MSRAYDDKEFNHSLWFNTFKFSELADWYILVGIYPKCVMVENAAEDETPKWDEIMLAFNKEEMKDFLGSIKQKKNPNKKDSKFGFGFNKSNEIFLNRGNVENVNFSKYLINNRIEEIKNSL